MAIYVGETIELEAVSTRLGVKIDLVVPVYFYVQRRGKGEAVSPGIAAVKSETGIWSVDFTPTKAGKHDYKVVDAGGVIEENEFYVKALKVS